MNKDLNLESFKEDGFIKFDDLIDRNLCTDLYLKVKNNRNWGKDLFLLEQEYKKNPQIKKVNPGKNIQNFVSKCNLDFIEKNPQIVRILKKILGENYYVILSKFVVAVPRNWMPNYVEEMDKKKPLKNFNRFIKKKYRDVTYFRGLDYHMDSIDRKNESNKFITMYVYLNNVDISMSPLELLKKSHDLGHTTSPHYIKKLSDKNYLEYSADNKNFKKYKKEILTGNVGSVYFWTSNTLHGTSEFKSESENFRISLRYLIEKNTKSKTLIDDIINQNKIGEVSRLDPADR